MILACLDLEGVLIPEIWMAVAEATEIPELRRTTRDEPDYDVLMRYRLDLLERHGIGIGEISEVIAGLDPLPGAREMLDWLRERHPVVILSDTFYGFAGPLLPKLGYPTIFCHELTVDAGGRISGYRLRMPDQKRAAVQAFHGLRFRTISAGDSYNDVSMLEESDAGILFRPPQNVIDELPQYPVARTYEDLRHAFEAAAQKIEPGSAGSGPASPPGASER